MTRARRWLAAAALFAAACGGSGGNGNGNGNGGGEPPPGTGTFRAGATIPVGANPESMVVGDFDGDGIGDFATANQGGNSISIFHGDGDGTFTQASDSPVSLVGPPSAIALGDMDGDGRLDLVAIGVNPTSVASHYAFVLLQDAGRVWQRSTTTLFDVDSPQQIALGDVDGDGDRDLLVTDIGGFGEILLLANAGSGSFTSVSSSPLTFLPFDIVVADRDGDGDADVIVGDLSNDLVVPLILVSGVLTEGTAPSNGGLSPRFLALGDLNGNGTLDVVAPSSGDASLAAYAGVGLALGDAVTSAVGDTGASDVAVGDLDGDGRLDAAWALSATGEVGVALGLGNGTFVAPFPSETAVGDNPLALGIADVDSDGLPDLLVANADSNTVSVLLQNPR